ncbi:hypothetical protein BC936DRAFT_139397 [Jimgerdemannia flammicorona]|uniref:Uncharacterized protein n=1 Tax=Jimgerdemannia flammicorona TaxID=994334 RepID=A0A433DHU0_9FUNG|nr:hypothetical protein BC936DRAFT_139397 [Jimgerdemannia flammicorona]
MDVFCIYNPAAALDPSTNSSPSMIPCRKWAGNHDSSKLGYVASCRSTATLADRHARPTPAADSVVDIHDVFDL